MLFQCWASVDDCGLTLKQHCVNGMCLLICWRKVYSRPSVGLVLSGCWPVPAMVVEGINVEDLSTFSCKICKCLVSN